MKRTFSVAAHGQIDMDHAWFSVPVRIADPDREAREDCAVRRRSGAGCPPAGDARRLLAWSSTR